MEQRGCVTGDEEHEVMPERRKEVCGMTGLPEEVMPERRKWVCGMTGL